MPEERQTVLLVDDDREIVRGAGLRLRAAGYRTLAVHDADAGIAAAADKLPAAIVLDVRMPRKDGLAALADLKQRPDTRDIPIIMLSASIVDQQRALDAGARFFLKKPYRGDLLVQAVNAAIADKDLHH